MNPRSVPRKTFPFLKAALRSFGLCLLLALTPLALQAQELSTQELPTSSAAESPAVVMQQTARTMFSALEQDQGRLSGDAQQVYALVERVLVPHVDFERASRWVLGRYWRQASLAQRTRFISEFRTLLVRFYSNALVAFLGAHHIDPGMVRFLPYKADGDSNEAVVRSLVRQPNGSEVQVNYTLHRGPTGWKVYDVTVEGISLVTTYRSSFAAEIRKDGLDGLIHTLSERNRKLLTAGH